MRSQIERIETDFRDFRSSGFLCFRILTPEDNTCQSSSAAEKTKKKLRHSAHLALSVGTLVSVAREVLPVLANPILRSVHCILASKVHLRVHCTVILFFNIDESAPKTYQCVLVGGSLYSQY